MRVTFFTWEEAKRQLQRLLGSVSYSCRAEEISAASAGDAFRVNHNLPYGIKPNSAIGIVMGAGYLYYNAGDRALWTANLEGTATQAAQQGYVLIRCSLAKARCEVIVAAYDA